MAIKVGGTQEDEEKAAKEKEALRVNPLARAIRKKILEVTVKEAKDLAQERTLKGYDTEKGANLDWAEKHERANSVKKPNVNLSERDVCLDCK